jgi:hypothetical protein
LYLSLPAFVLFYRYFSVGKPAMDCIVSLGLKRYLGQLVKRRVKRGAHQSDLMDGAGLRECVSGSELTKTEFKEQMGGSN